MNQRPVVLRGDARNIPLPDESVDLIVTSPPYFGLRSYTDTRDCPKCRDLIADGRDPRQAWPDYQAHWDRDHKPLPYDGQIGSEATPGEWLAALVECTREWVRVLKPQGSLFVNLGDKYAAGHGGSSTEGKGITIRKRSSFAANPRERPDLPDPPASWGTRDVTGRNVVPGTAPKSLLGLPWRYALACTDQLGLILRAEIIWAKPNGLPESVTDRVRRAHEQVFHFTRQPRYYAAVDEIREDYLEPDRKRADVFGGNSAAKGIRHAGPGVYTGPTSPLGKLPGSVWTIPSQPLTVPAHLGIDHFAAFPMELPRRLVLGWSPPGVCVACGQGRRPVVLRGFGQRAETSATITGYACACPQPTAPTRPATVLDPFAGTGTTMLVASALGRIGVGVDRSADYCRLAQWRVNDPAERAKAMEVPKPPPVPDGAVPLFEIEDLGR